MPHTNSFKQINMSTITLFGIKNCDTVRKAKKWLEKEAPNFQFVDFREDGLTEEQIKHWSSALSWETIFNKRSTSFRNLTDADKADIDEAKAIKLMLEYPTLIKRPILVVDNQVYTGFKAEQYQEIFK